MSNTCENCIFWHKRFNGAISGECRFDPPKLVETDYAKGVTRFPETDGDTWCGKFQPKTEQVNYEVSVGE